jgi:hypothetical protein
LRWQDQENRLTEVRQRLARQYLALRRQAEQVRSDEPVGVLRAARVLLDQPLDPGNAKLKAQVHQAFALLGRGFWHRAPSLLEAELAHYAAGIENSCRGHAELGARLQLAQAVIRIFARNPEFCHPQYYRLALISPESAWLLFHLRQKRLKVRQGKQDVP